MGEYADMMLEGDLCEGCGVFLRGPSDGEPRRCSSCAEDARAEKHQQTLAAQKAAKKVSCPTCGKRVKGTGLADHQRDAHGDRAPSGSPLQISMHRLPGHSRTVLAPVNGWKPHTVYLVKVSVAPTNPVHKALLHTGFLEDDGSLGNYCNVWQNSYDEGIHASKFHYLEAVMELTAMS